MDASFAFLAFGLFTLLPFRLHAKGAGCGLVGFFFDSCGWVLVLLEAPGFIEYAVFGGVVDLRDELTEDDFVGDFATDDCFLAAGVLGAFFVTVGCEAFFGVFDGTFLVA